LAVHTDRVRSRHVVAMVWIASCLTVGPNSKRARHGRLEEMFVDIFNNFGIFLLVFFTIGTIGAPVVTFVCQKILSALSADRGALHLG